MARVALRSAYLRIVFSAEAALLVTGEQGIDCMEGLDILTDGDIENMCKFVRRPGGINPITNVANLGLQVSLRAENDLKLARFFLKHKIRTGRVALTTYITLDNVRSLSEIKNRKRNTRILCYLL